MSRDEHDAWEAFSELEDSMNRTDPSLAAYLERQWRFRHGRAVFAALYAIGPALIVGGLVSGLTALLVAGVLLTPATPVLSSLIIKRSAPQVFQRLIRLRREPRYDANR